MTASSTGSAGQTRNAQSPFELPPPQRPDQILTSWRQDFAFGKATVPSRPKSLFCLLKPQSLDAPAWLLTSTQFSGTPGCAFMTAPCTRGLSAEGTLRLLTPDDLYQGSAVITVRAPSLGLRRRHGPADHHRNIKPRPPPARQV